MMPAGPLMTEHRTIEKIVPPIRTEIERIRRGFDPDLGFLRSAVDFLKVYADRCHHGKEEDILFRALAEKDLPEELGLLMGELTAEHVWARGKTGDLADAVRRLDGGEAAVVDVAGPLEELSVFYPRHIEREDNRFFLPAMEFLSEEEQAEMFAAFQRFDGRLLHDVYASRMDEMADLGGDVSPA